MATESTVCTRCEMEHNEDDLVNCIYCNRLVSCVLVPGESNDDAWAAIAAEHTDTCEWVQTRAHRVA